jgi:ankyrin repeat protein
MTAFKGHLGSVRKLLKDGAKLECVDNQDWTPLNIAALKFLVCIIRVLLNHCANFEISNKDGYSPLNIVGSNGHVQVA